jgi:hypothetical protein
MTDDLLATCGLRAALIRQRTEVLISDGRERELEQALDLLDAGRMPYTLTVEQAASEIGIRPRAVRDAIKRGRLTGAKHGRNLYVDPKSARSYRARVRRRGPRSKMLKE